MGRDAKILKVSVQNKEKKATKKPTAVYYSTSQSATYKVSQFCNFSGDFTLQKETRNKM